MARGGGPAFPFAGVRPGGYGGSRDSRPSHAKSDRERHIDGDDDDYSPPPFTNGDLDGDGDVDIFDFGIFAPDFGCGVGS